MGPKINQTWTFAALKGQNRPGSNHSRITRPRLSSLHRKVELEQDLSGSVGDDDQPLGALPSILASDEVTKNSERFITRLCKP
jgi:hypothetical protein